LRGSCSRLGGTISREPSRRPRILFLADRNTLANQAFNDFNSFAAFEDNALVRVDPDEIRKKGRVPKNAIVFFTIFQTFMTGKDAQGNPAPYFGEYPPDFFDFIVIDECHRGGANDESTWREILTYFKPAVQLGLTATPKRMSNVDTYKYFGEPVYRYSLKDGINDGFLTPFKVKQIATTLDDYTYTPDDAIVEGEVVPGKRYVENDGEYDISTSVPIEDWQSLELQDRRDVLDEAKRSAPPGARAIITADLVAV
jgi:type I restriction enzyme, R subunit